MKKNTLICLLDKQYPPDHSFITGMLAQALPRNGGVRVELLVMAPEDRPRPPARYHQSVCLPMVPDFSRGGRSRLRAILAALRLTYVLIAKARRRGERVVLFVRNHPVLMLVAASLRHRVDGFIFQSSYPLELQHKNPAWRFVHRGFLRIGGCQVDGVLAVSPLGLRRAQALCSREAAGLVIPLLSDLPRGLAADVEIWGGGKHSIRFIYIGTHVASRQLNVVLEGLVAALNTGVDAAFVFLGGKPREFSDLRQSPGVSSWENAGRIRFLEAVPRRQIPEVLFGADVGLCLVPETSTNREASPTKLAEYMGAGLAVLASRGVDLQEAFIRESNAGIVIPFDASSIADGIRKMVSDPVFLSSCKANAETFANAKLNYSYYVAALKTVLGGFTDQSTSGQNTPKSPPHINS